MTAVVRALLAMAPALRAAVVSLIMVIRGDDPVAARRALEAALRLQFEARQAITK
jgi:hypothetical protein